MPCTRNQVLAPWSSTCCAAFDVGSRAGDELPDKPVPGPGKGGSEQGCDPGAVGVAGLSRRESGMGGGLSSSRYQGKQGLDRRHWKES